MKDKIKFKHIFRYIIGLYPMSILYRKKVMSNIFKKNPSHWLHTNKIHDLHYGSHWKICLQAWECHSLEHVEQRALQPYDKEAYKNKLHITHLW